MLCYFRKIFSCKTKTRRPKRVLDQQRVGGRCAMRFLRRKSFFAPSWQRWRHNKRNSLPRSAARSRCCKIHGVAVLLE